jgi:predicted ATP-dependent protease
MKEELSSNAVRKTHDPSTIKGLVTTEIEADEIIGQERAVTALQLGLGIKADGFNIYASGIQGTGKLTAIKSFLLEPAKKQPVPDDWCYVNNFSDPYQPTKLRLPAGRASEFKTDLKNLIHDVHQALVKAFELEDFVSRKAKITDQLVEKQEALFNSVNERAEKESILVQGTPVDITTVPLKDGKPMTDEEFSKLEEPEQTAICEKQEKYLHEIKIAVKEARKLEKEAHEEILKLERETAKFAISTLIEEVEEKYATLAEIMRHLKDIREDILANLTEFLGIEKPNSVISPKNNDFIGRYEVNVLVDNKDIQGAPVVIELNPTYNNLFGRVEKESHMGTWVTDIALIRKGSLHAANGGYLIIRVEELFKNLFSWESLKRALKNKEIVIEEAGDQWGFITTKTLRPQSLPLNVKVILIGDPFFYHVLYTYDNDFKELFKVKADFDTSMPCNDKNIKDYIRFCIRLGTKEALAPIHEHALCKIVEHGSRLAEDQTKLSTTFSEIADVIREANYYALMEKSDGILSSHIQKAIEQKIYRSNMIQESINEMIGDKQILIDIKGQKAGQVNGLTVVSLGDLEIGLPSRITCSISIGDTGVIAIEREAKMSGPIHTKGVIILTGYLAEKFVQNKPLSLNAQIVFEQSYSEVDGDSASSAELYSLLSTLADSPIKQGIAVTGSLNQKGEIQAIGGVNEKIEGYFEVCKIIGLNGEQGVIIPSANVRNLMLKEEVQAAIENKSFRVWAIDTVEEGIEILTGLKFGTVDEAGTISYLVNNRLNEYADKMKAFSTEERLDIYK